MRPFNLGLITACLFLSVSAAGQRIQTHFVFNDNGKFIDSATGKEYLVVNFDGKSPIEIRDLIWKNSKAFDSFYLFDNEVVTKENFIKPFGDENTDLGLSFKGESDVRFFYKPYRSIIYAYQMRFTFRPGRVRIDSIRVDSKYYTEDVNTFAVSSISSHLDKQEKLYKTGFKESRIGNNEWLREDMVSFCNYLAEALLNGPEEIKDDGWGEAQELISEDQIFFSLSDKGAFKVNDSDNLFYTVSFPGFKKETIETEFRRAIPSIVEVPLIKINNLKSVEPAQRFGAKGFIVSGLREYGSEEKIVFRTRYYIDDEKIKVYPPVFTQLQLRGEEREDYHFFVMKGYIDKKGEMKPSSSLDYFNLTFNGYANRPLWIVKQRLQELSASSEEEW